MTEKTDIAALREAALKATAAEWCTDSQHSVIADAGLNANYYVAACSGPDSKANAKFIALANPATIIALLDQLEAERQRADAAESYARERDSENESIALTVGRLRTELAALRGTQDPDHYHLHTPTTGAVIYYPASQKEIVKAIKDDLEGDVVVTELFTRQPKPVVDLTNVLKVPYRISGQSFAAYDSDDLHAALEADGIVVNDGELATITCWSCRKSMNLAQHSSNDGLCPHCNVEIDLEE